MSNTAEVSPYASTTIEPTRREALAQALTAARARAEQGLHAQRRAALAAQPSLLQLHAGARGSLLHTAQRLGYRVQQKSAGPGPTLLCNAAGQWLALQVEGTGLLVAGTVEHAGLQAIVGESVLGRVNAHLARLSAGAAMQTRTLADGAVEVRTQEAGRGAQLQVQVQRDGQLKVDIGCVRGRRCEVLMEDLAQAVSGSAHNQRIKTEYYDSAPGEPARMKVS